MRSDYPDAPIDPRPFPIRGEYRIGIGDAAHRDHECVRKAQGGESRAVACGTASHDPINVVYDVNDSIDECLRGAHGCSSNSAGADQNLGKGAGRKYDSVAICARLTQCLYGFPVVGVVRV